MSAALYGRDSAGVNRQIKKLYVNVGGVNRELKELWARDSGGVNRKIFSAAITWTIQTEVINTSGEGGYIDWYGDVALRAYAEPPAGIFTARAIHTFSSPLVMPQGSTIDFSCEIEYTGAFIFYINNQSVFSKAPLNNNYTSGTYTNTWTATSETAINSIKCEAKASASSNVPYGTAMYVTIHLSDDSSFVLNSSGTSENQ